MRFLIRTQSLLNSNRKAHHVSQSINQSLWIYASETCQADKNFQKRVSSTKEAENRLKLDVFG